MNIVFAGTPPVAVPTLAALVSKGFSPKLVITRPDAPVGRKRILTPSPVAKFAEQHNLPLLKTDKIDHSIAAELPERLDLGIVVAFGGLVREPILSFPKQGWVNLHFSKLPAWRGAAPVQRSLLAGEKTTALTVFKLVAALDAGDILLQQAVEFQENDTTDSALARFSILGAELISENIQKLLSAEIPGKAQIGQISKAAKFARSDGYLDWQLPSAELYQRYQAVTSEPGAWAELLTEPVKLPELAISSVQAAKKLAPGELCFQNGKLMVGTGSDSLEIRRIQPPGKPAMDAASWWRGRQAKQTP